MLGGCGSIEWPLPGAVPRDINTPPPAPRASSTAFVAAGDRVTVLSAGSEPKDKVNPIAVEAMAEEGIDIANNVPKILTTQSVVDSDVVVTMGCGDACPIYPGKRYEDWVLEDPAGQDIETVRGIRDDIKRRVEALLTEIAPAH